MCHRFAAAVVAVAADARFDRERTVARPRAGADVRTPRLAAFVRPRRVYASGRGVSGGGGGPVR